MIPLALNEPTNPSCMQGHDGCLPGTGCASCQVHRAFEKGRSCNLCAGQFQTNNLVNRLNGPSLVRDEPVKSCRRISLTQERRMLQTEPDQVNQVCAQCHIHWTNWWPSLQPTTAMLWCVLCQCWYSHRENPPCCILRMAIDTYMGRLLTEASVVFSSELQNCVLMMVLALILEVKQLQN